MTTSFPVPSEWEACISDSSFKQQTLRTRELERTICTNMHEQCQDTHVYLNASVILSSSHNKHPQSILWDKWSLSYPRFFKDSEVSLECRLKKNTKKLLPSQTSTLFAQRKETDYADV